MDIQDFIPASGASIRDFHQTGTREPAATFTQTQTTPPGRDLAPLGGELDCRAPSLSSANGQGGTRQRETAQERDARPGRAGTDTGEGFDLQATSRMIRSALRGGAS